MVTLTIKKPLTTADFKAQLYIGLLEVRGMLMLPLTPIEWGQRHASVGVTERGCFDRIGVFDRQEGGQPLDGTPGPINNGPLTLRPGDTVNLDIHWPGK